jgi:hypothetical protein
MYCVACVPAVIVTGTVRGSPPPRSSTLCGPALSVSVSGVTPAAWHVDAHFGAGRIRGDVERAGGDGRGGDRRDERAARRVSAEAQRIAMPATDAAISVLLAPDGSENLRLLQPAVRAAPAE